MRKSGTIKKIIIYVLISIILITAGLFVYGGKSIGQYPDYSSYSAKPMGVKALYLLTGQMGYAVERYERAARFLPDKATLIAINPGIDTFNDKSERKALKEWLQKGNTLILVGNIADIDQYELHYFSGLLPILPYKNGEDITHFSVGKGKVVFLEDDEAYTNEGLKSLDAGITFIAAIEKAGSKTVLFNEYYHGSGGDGVSLWDLLGQTGRLLVIQGFLALIILMLVKARRFGKPVTVFEIVKRKENENMFALSNIYSKARADSLVLETYFNSFKKQLSRFLGFSFVPEDSAIIDAAYQNKVLKDKNLKGLFNACYTYIEVKRKDTKQLMNLVEHMEKIKEQIM